MECCSARAWKGSIFFCSKHFQHFKPNNFCKGVDPSKEIGADYSLLYLESYFNMFFHLEARLWIVLLLWPDQPQIKELSDFVSIVMCLSCRLWVCCNTVFLSLTGKVEMERHEHDWSCRSTCRLFHSMYSWNQFYFPLVKKKKKHPVLYMLMPQRRIDKLQFNFLDLSLTKWEGIVRQGCKVKYPICKLKCQHGIKLLQ